MNMVVSIGLPERAHPLKKNLNISNSRKNKIIIFGNSKIVRTSDLLKKRKTYFKFKKANNKKIFEENIVILKIINNSKQ